MINPTPTALDETLRHFRDNPELLPLYLGRHPAQDIEHRRLQETHICARCGRRAEAALITEPSTGPRRWLDLCPPCLNLLFTEETRK
jgi:hypothetical protein